MIHPPGTELRRHDAGDTRSSALYSTCYGYRYALERRWDEAGSKLLFVMLNPSKATELQNDPTVERCERRARALGYGAFAVCNIFAWRETHPKLLRQAKAPIGPLNDHMLEVCANAADMVLCAWGVHGEHLDRGPDVEALLRKTGRPLSHLGLTKHGHPRHPLYVSYSIAPILWRTRFG